MSNRPDILNYIEFFEAEPEWVHEMGWFYGARFVTTRGQDTIIATVAPDEPEFSLEWHQGSRCLMRFKLVKVTEWFIQNRNGKEQLILKTSSDRETLCIVTLKPEVAVEMEMCW
jgi:hypothetical protein